MKHVVVAVALAVCLRRGNLPCRGKRTASEGLPGGQAWPDRAGDQGPVARKEPASDRPGRKRQPAGGPRRKVSRMGRPAVHLGLSRVAACQNEAERRRLRCGRRSHAAGWSGAAGGEGVEQSGQDTTALAGVYLLAYTGEFSDKEKESGTVSLVSVSVDKDGNTVIQQIFGVPATRYTRRGTLPMAAETGTGERSSSRTRIRCRSRILLGARQRRWRFTSLTARYRSYEFQLDLRITML